MQDLHRFTGIDTCKSLDSLVHMLLLLPIKEYAEGPVEIRGRSTACTRRVRSLYAESLLNRTRRVFGFFRFTPVFVGNLQVISQELYAEGPQTVIGDQKEPLMRKVTVRGRSKFVRGGSEPCTRKVLLA